VASGECEILTLAVRPAERRQGVATALLRAAFATASEGSVKSCFLEVAADNRAARNLYAREGFAPVGRRKAYYRRASGARVDALVMRRPAPPPSP
jgi:ribosomal-protein-alanine N-acetyltransferase